MTRIAGIAGSCRRGSVNAALLGAAVELAPEGVEIITGSIVDVPLYNGDLETDTGVPQAVEELKNLVSRADALLLVSPEYNNSIPGVMKNTLDWMSRPPADIARVFKGKPVALIGATPGMVGTRFAQTAWLPVLRALGMNPWFGQQLYVGGAHKIFDESGRLMDDDIRMRLERFVTGFCEFVGGRDETGDP